MTDPASQLAPGKTATIISALVALIMLAASGYVLIRQFHGVSPGAVAAAIAAQPAGNVIASLLFTAVSFAILSSYDAFAVHMVAPRRVPLRTAVLAGASANAIANVLGFHAITATAVRLRIYGRAGLALGDIARVISLSGAAIGLSFVTTVAFALLAPRAAGGTFQYPDILRPLLGASLLAALVLLLAWLAKEQRTVTFFRFRIVLPPARLAAIQMGAGVVEMTAAIAALYVLLPADFAPPFAAFAVAMTVALALGVAGSTPGGVGVFEAAVVAMLGMKGRPDLLAALIVYRLAYYVLPFALSLAALGIHEIAAARRR
ncbi:MAG: UPF0104 family protein [Rhizomicrobium sp.]